MYKYVKDKYSQFVPCVTSQELFTIIIIIKKKLLYNQYMKVYVFEYTQSNNNGMTM